MDQKTIEQIKAAKSVQEIAETARKENITLSDGQAEALYKQYHTKEGELSDQELNNVAGGTCSSAETLRKEGKYMEISEDYVCYAFEWAYGIYSKEGQKMCCFNCHHSMCAIDSKKSGMSDTGDLVFGSSYFCEYHTLK
jgi:hypothetical protein